MAVRKPLDLVGVIGAVHDAEEMRRITLEVVRELVWYDAALFWLKDPLTGLPLGPPLGVDVPRRSLEPYLQNYGHHRDPLFHEVQRRRVAVARFSDLMEHPKWVRTEIFNECYRPHDMHYGLGCEIVESRQTYGTLMLFRSRSSGDFSTRDRNLVQFLQPHLVNRLRWQYLLRNLGPLAQRLTPAVDARFPFTELTRRERDIARLVLLGAGNQEIAAELGITESTVKMHLQNIFVKLGITRRSQLSTLYLLAYGWDS